MLARLVLAQSASSPASIAMTWLGGEATYEKLAQDVEKVSSALVQLKDLTPSLVGIIFSDPYHHWVMLLSLLRLSIPSATLPVQFDATFNEFIDKLAPDIILSERPVTLPHGQLLVLDEAWFSYVLENGQDIFVPDSVIPDNIVRVALVNGTNGQRRRVKLTSRYIEISLYHLVSADLKNYGDVKSELRVVPTLGPTTITGFFIVLAAFMSGTKLQMLEGRELGFAFSQKQPTLAVISPLHAMVILDQLPPGMAPLPHLYLTVAGGRLPAVLREKIREKLTRNIRIVYGAEECGLITAGQAASDSEDAVGKAFPWVNLEIVDSSHAPVPHGTSGQVRVSGTGVIDGYDGDPDASQAQFRDGWFYPGDMGVLQADGTLHLKGRSDDIVNLGGEKYDLTALDGHVKKFPGVLDAAMFLVNDDDGFPALWLALVTQSDFKLDGLSSWLREVYPSLPQAAVIFTANIPRHDGGNPDRAILAKAVQKN